MGFPLKSNYRPKEALCQISLDDLNTICNVLNTIGIELAPSGTMPEIRRLSATGRNWSIVIPASAESADELTVVTDVQFDGTNLQKKTRKVKVAFIEGEEESDWTTIVGGTAEDCDEA